MLITFLLLITLSYLATCAPFTPENFCFSSCQQILHSIQFEPAEVQQLEPCSGWECECANRLGITSLYLCSRIYCSTEERGRGIADLDQTCRTYANVTLPPYSIVEGYTEEEIALLRHLQTEDIFEAVPVVVHEVVVPSERVFKLARDTLDAAYFEAKIHAQYGFAMYYFWLAVVSIGLSSRLARLIGDRCKDPKWRPLPTSPSSTNSSFKSNGPTLSTPYMMLKRYLTVPATFGYTRSQNLGWWGTIPTRVQSITIAAFVILNIVLCSISYHVFEDNLYWRDIPTQLWRYVADRTGVISTANLILIWVFGMRNNTLLWLTGWDFATYNQFHRWVARVATVEAVVHSVAYTVLIFKGDSWKAGWDLYVNYFHQRWFFTGVLATIFMAAICGVSIYGIRRNFYEVFLLSHIALSVLVIVTMWYHIEIFNGEYNWYIWPCVIVWILDRMLRFLRIFLFNPRFWNTKALATYDTSSNIVRLTVPYSTSFIKPKPGTFYYITVLNDWRVWESHPFTLGYSTLERQSLLPTHPRRHSLSPTYLHSFSDNEPLLRNQPSSESETLLKTTTPTPPSSMVFIIRPYDGFTGRLRDSALLQPTKLRVLIDGPYGETQPFRKYENVLFIVGGAGITVPLSYLSQLLGEESHTTSLKIVWALKESKFLIDAIEIDFRDALEREEISLTAHITKNPERLEIESLPKKVRVLSGRPDILTELEAAATESENRPLAVVACGPGRMADDTRKAVVEMLAKGWSRIEYFEESFNW